MSKLSNYLKTNGLNALSNAMLGNPVGAITSLFGLTGSKTEEGIIEVLSSNSEKLNELKKREIEFADMIFQDKENARKMNVDINNSVNSSWLSKNIVAILSIIWTVSTILIYLLAILGYISSEVQITMLVVNSVTNILSLVIGFYFGDSNGKKEGAR